MSSYLMLLLASPRYMLRAAGRAAALLVLILSPTLGSGARAATPEDALKHHPAEFERLQEDVVRAEGEVQRAYLGLSGALIAEPLLRYQEDLRDLTLEPSFGPSIDLRAELDYAYDQVGILVRHTELLQAQKRLADVQRDTLRDALLTHAEVLAAQFNLSLEQSRFKAARLALMDVEALALLGEASQTDVMRARFDLDSAQRGVDGADYTLRNARSRGTSYSLGGKASFKVLTFSLPEVKMEESFAYQVAVLELERAQAQALRDSVYAVVEEVRLGTQYRGDNYEVSGGVGLYGGVPGAGVDARYFDTDPEEWTITLGARLRLDGRSVDDFGTAQRSIEEVRARLDRIVRTFDRDLQDARAAAQLARRSVELSERDLELFDLRIAELETELADLPEQLEPLRMQLSEAQTQLDALRTQRDAAEETERASLDTQVMETETQVMELDAQVRELEQELTFTQQDLDQTHEFRNVSESSLYRNWTDYIRAVHNYLSLADGAWEVRR